MKENQLSLDEETTSENVGIPNIANKQQTKKNTWIIGLVSVAILVLGINYLSGRHKHNNLESSQYSLETNAPQITHTVGSTNKNVSVSSDDKNSFTQRAALEKEVTARIRAPIMIVNQQETQTTTKDTGTNNTENFSNTTLQPQNNNAANNNGNINTAFYNNVSNQDMSTVYATHIGPLDRVIGEGTLIHANLETAINSDLPGFLRAVISQDVYAEDGNQVLIPKGSRLIGQYRSGLSLGDSRIFIVWTRIIEPNGISVNVASPGVDNLGVAGQAADDINRHFFERFGQASLLAIISADK